MDDSIKLKKLALLHELDVIDVRKESRSLATDELRLEQHLISSLNVINRQEEIYWKQRAKLQWLKEGDGNTKFFHSMANGRKNRNFMTQILHEGHLLENPLDIGKAFTSRFKQQFSHQRDARLRVDFRKLLANKLEVDLSALERPGPCLLRAQK